MGDAKRRRKAAEPIKFFGGPAGGGMTDKTLNVPVTDNGPDITATDIFPTVDAMWLEFAKHPALQDVSRERREMTKYAFMTAISETLRTVAFRMNADQSTAVFDDFGAELQAYDRELQRIAKSYAAALN